MRIAESDNGDLGLFLKRRRPAFLLLDEALRFTGADPGALELLAEAYGGGVPTTGEMPPELTEAILALCSKAEAGDFTVSVGQLLIHLRVLRGREKFYLISLERLAVRDHLKQSTERYELTRRETQVLSLILDGMRANDIALELKISPMTVRDYFTNLLRKTGSRNRSEMLAKLMNA